MTPDEIKVFGLYMDYQPLLRLTVISSERSVPTIDG